MSKRFQGGILGVGFNPLQAPNAPTNVTATGGDASASVSFTAPSNVGGSAITGYTVQSNPGAFSATGSASPISVTGLTNGTSYTFQVWALNSYGPSPAGGPSGSVTPATPIALFMGGNNSTINYKTISTLGNATSFGTLSPAGYFMNSACASSTRGLLGGTGAGTNLISYMTIASTGSVSTFGNLGYTSSGSGVSALSNSTYGYFFGGDSGFGGQDIRVVTIATTGNSTLFGSVGASISGGCGGCASPTRGVFMYGFDSSWSGTVQYFTLATTGSTTNFGFVGAKAYATMCSNSTRGLIAGGWNGSTSTKFARIDYFEITTTGTIPYFGDLTQATQRLGSAASSTRAIFAGGYAASNTSAISYVTIASTGNAASFGNLTFSGEQISGLSNAHGGL